MTTEQKQMKIGEDFRIAAKNKNIKIWPVHNCSICDYLCGFVFEDDNAFYDSGCYCTYNGNGSNLEPIDWHEVANHYNIQNNENVVAEMNEFWDFKGTL